MTRVRIATIGFDFGDCVGKGESEKKKLLTFNPVPADVTLLLLLLAGRPACDIGKLDLPPLPRHHNQYIITAVH